MPATRNTGMWVKISVYVLAVLFALRLFTPPGPTEYHILVAGDFTEDKENPKAIDGIAQGAKAQAEELAKNSPVVFTIAIADDDNDNSQAQRKALEQAVAKPEVLAVIGHSRTDTTEAALEVYGPQELLLIVPLATSPPVTAGAEHKGWRNVFRLTGNDYAQAVRIAHQANSLRRKAGNTRPVVLVHGDNDYANRLKDYLQNALSQAGVKEVKPFRLRDYKDEEGRYDFVTIAGEVLSEESSLLVFAGSGAEGRSLMQQLRGAGYSRAVLLPDSCSTTTPGQEYWLKGADVYVTSFVPLKGGDGVIPGKGETAYRKLGADCIRLLHQAAEVVVQKGQPLNRVTLANCLNQQRKDDRKWSKDFNLGPYKFDDSGNNSLSKVYLYLLRKGKSSLTWEEVL